jgi:hypothetical protein
MLRCRHSRYALNNVDPFCLEQNGRTTADRAEKFSDLPVGSMNDTAVAIAIRRSALGEDKMNSLFFRTLDVIQTKST